jgi:thiamine biosynthesis lipoprotein
MCKRGVSILVLLAISLNCYTVRSQEWSKFTFSQPGMGTLFTLTFYAIHEQEALEASKASFLELERLEQIFSDYRSDSYINQLSADIIINQPKVLPTEVFEVLQLSHQLYVGSGGAFDPTIGPLTKLWRRAQQIGLFPKDQTILKAKNQVGFDRVRLNEDDNSIVFLADSIQFDFGGIAKGYCADRIAVILESYGIQSYLIDAGGDLLIGDSPPHLNSWTVGIEGNDQSILKIAMTNTAIATSGSTYRYLLHEGIRYSHIIDPRTGYGVTHHQVLSVQASSAALADALASTLSIIDPKQGELLITEKFPEVTYQVFNHHQKIP